MSLAGSPEQGINCLYDERLDLVSPSGTNYVFIGMELVHAWTQSNGISNYHSRRSTAHQNKYQNIHSGCNQMLHQKQSIKRIIREYTAWLLNLPQSTAHVVTILGAGDSSTSVRQALNQVLDRYPSTNR
jgi:hypothetical protein